MYDYCVNMLFVSESITVNGRASRGATVLIAINRFICAALPFLIDLLELFHIEFQEMTQFGYRGPYNQAVSSVETGLK